MFTLQDLVQPDTLEEAYSVLTQRKPNAVLGGCAFLRLGSKKIGAAVDLSKLNLAFIQEEAGQIEIGAMTTLRDLETHPLLQRSFNGILPKAVGQIIGVQFRNAATVGASVFSRYGFSDLITALLALDTRVHLHKGGVIPLAEFLEKPFQKDILTKVIIKQEDRAAAFEQLRNSASDFPLLNIAVSISRGEWKIAVGARPHRAKLAVKAAQALNAGTIGQAEILDAACTAAEELTFGSNARGSAAYRKEICRVLVQRAVRGVMSC